MEPKSGITSERATVLVLVDPAKSGEAEAGTDCPGMGLELPHGSTCRGCYIARPSVANTLPQLGDVTSAAVGYGSSRRVDRGMPDEYSAESR